MRSLITTSATLVLVFACAHTLAWDESAGGVSANGRPDATGPSAIAFDGVSSRAVSSDTKTARQITLNRSGPERPAAHRTTGAKTAANRLPLSAPLPRRAAARRERTSWLDIQANKPISTVLAGLSIVLGAFLLLAWAVRKRMPKGSARLPDEIIEVLGRTSIAAKQSLHLVRVGSKLIVVSVTASGTETLTEVTDAGEVARILAACQQHHAHSSTTAFRQVFEQLGNEPAHGFLGSRSERSRNSTSDSRAA